MNILFESTQPIWFTADLHYSHKNICKATSKWVDGYRDFQSLDEMNNTIIQNIDITIGDAGILFILGDVALNKKYFDEAIQRIIKPDRTIYLILGNHDPIGQTEVIDGIDYIVKDLKIDVDDQQILLSHYRENSRNFKNSKIWNLHGHEHGRGLSRERQLDVGIDSIYKMYNEYRPISYKEIKNFFQKI